MTLDTLPTTPPILTVTALNQLAHEILKTYFPSVWVEGEISNFIRATSGHLYFSLKDSKSQVKCVMFATQYQKILFQIQNGMHVLLRAQASLYEARGDFQLIVSYVEELGIGALKRAYEQLKTKLQQEGLFDSSRKKPLPHFPRCIGIITSPKGAAIHDVLNILNRRFPLAETQLYAVQVQGETAPQEIVAAIQLANQEQSCDVLILCRGGGSFEDLQPFNTEVVARSIAASQIPIITGIGHEVDYTIADFVADVRAPTPSAAAEIVSVDQYQLRHTLQQMREQLQNKLIAKWMDQVRHYQQLKTQLAVRHPHQILLQFGIRLDDLSSRLTQSKDRLTEQTGAQLQKYVSTLEALNPLKILLRGYSILSNANGEVIRSEKQVTVGEKLQARLAEGSLECEVKKTELYLARNSPPEEGCPRRRRGG